ncbi:helix-turn-helix domain-containing protein [Mucilaginibacter agri]|uniref:Helix-turn-helix domain-containing protein n=1 Tax=Mucilaginibacter agri TaxID=2695265 RepID=A0A966DQT8_9SPHI|nr:helix-turn-helix transcriptional regulator [Mucilaginibacter agri]NCD68333.1 helix-turn-helix domain-containing protein [Mucilaginibacter agri]
MELHYGRIIERKIKISGYSVGDVARLTGVNRRSVHNWFNCRKLNIQTIERIAHALNCDFSPDFPDLFPKGHFSSLESELEDSQMKNGNPVPPESSEAYWINKYLVLLKSYNGLLEGLAQPVQCND